MSTDPKILTEAGWRAVATDGLRDEKLRKALRDRQKAVDDDDLERRLAASAEISSLASSLKRDAAGDKEVAEHLKKMLAAAQSEMRDLTRARGAAGKASAAGADDEEHGSYEVKLKKALDGLKTASKPYNFVVCVAKTYALALCRGSVTTAHLKELTEVTGGSRRFLKRGTCTRDGDRLIFEMENPPKGLARKLRRSLDLHAKKKFKITVGDESADEDGPLLADEHEDAHGRAGGTDPGAAEKEPGRPAPAKPALERMPEVWSTTQRVVKAKIEQLKGAVREVFASEGPDLLREIEGGMKKLDSVFQRLDDDLAALLEKAAAASGAARAAELSKAKALLTKHVEFVKSEPMIKHIDSNPFGIATNLQDTLMKSLRAVVQAVGEA